MTFGNPALLVLLIVPVLLLVATWRRRRARVVLPLDHAAAPRGRGLAAFLLVFESMPALVLAVAILLLAGPQRQGEPSVKRRLTNIEFCVDVSGSMVAKFGEGTRYDASMRAINQFLDYRSGDAFGLTFFGSAILHWVPLTSDVSAFRCAPPFMRPGGHLPDWFQSTHIGDALLACRKVLLKREEGDRMILLISDGYSSDLGNGREEEIARQLRDDGIVVYSVHIAEGTIPEQIVTLTAITGGEAFQTDDPRALEVVFRRIDTMQQTELEKTAPESLDDFEPVAYAGLSVLSLLVLAAFGLRFTPW